MSNNNFKAGMEKASGAFEKKFEAQGDAVSLAHKEISSELNNISNVQGALIDVVEQQGGKLDAFQKRVLYGLDIRTDIGALEETQRSLIAGILLYFAKNTEAPNDMQQQYVARVLNYLHVANPSADTNLAGIESIDSMALQKTILQVVLEYVFLENQDFEFLVKSNAIQTCFSVNQKGIEEIENYILKIFHAVGAKGMIEKYGFTQDLQAEAVVGNEAAAPETEAAAEEEIIVWEDIVLKGTIQIGKDETKTFKNKSVHINAFVQCHGNLIFENCEIFYNEKMGEPCQITLEEDSSLSIEKCTIVCKNDSEKVLLEIEYASNITITDSLFGDCPKFISGDLQKGGKFYLTKCRIINPHQDFFNLHGGDIKISRSIISFNKAMPPKDVFHPCVFGGSCGADGSFSIETVLVEGFEGLNKKGEDIRTTNFRSVFGISDALFYRCTFKNIIGCINRAATVSHCRFEDCDEVVEFGILNLNNNVKKLEQCIFERCENVVENSTTTDILYCQFLSCRNQLVHSGMSGSCSVQYCEFYNTRFESTLCSATACLTAAACLTFDRMKGKNIHSSRIKNCVFDGVELVCTNQNAYLYDMGNGFLIRGKLYDKIDGVAVWIENCYFHNCKTNRDDKRIIEMRSFYTRPFSSKLIEIKSVSISDCSGLDNVNQENGVADDVPIRTIGEKDAVIGATFEFGMDKIGIVGKPD